MAADQWEQSKNLGRQKLPTTSVGMWPNGESDAIRRAYDAQQANRYTLPQYGTKTKVCYTCRGSGKVGGQQCSTCSGTCSVSG